MIRRALMLVIGFALLAGAVFGVTTVEPAALPLVTRVVPPVDTKVACGHLAGEGTAFLAAGEESGELGQDLEPMAGPQMLEKQEAPVVATGTQVILGGFLDQADDWAAWTPCGGALSTGYLVVPNPQNTDLLVLNSDPTDASVDLTLYGPEGEITAPGARGIAVTPGGTREVALSVLADVEGPVGVKFNASRGRATVIARTTTSDSADTMAAAQPGQEFFLPGVPDGVQEATLAITNLSDDRAEAAVTAYGASASYTPAGGEDISVPPGSTVAVDLGEALDGEASGLKVTVDQQAVASLAVAGEGDPAFLTPQPASTELGAYSPGAGRLQLTNPGDGAAEATMSTGETVTVAAGQTASVDLGESPEVITVTSSVPLVGAIEISDGKALAVVPLVDVTSLEAAPIDAEQDPTLR